MLLEATVHLLDVQRALGCPPAVPPQALNDTAQLLAELAPAVEFIEAANWPLDAFPAARAALTLLSRAAGQLANN